MTKLDQPEEEMEVLRFFSKHYPTPISSIESRKPPEPDILCVTSEGTQRAFEIVQLIDKGLARSEQAKFKLEEQLRCSFESLDAATKNRLLTILHNATVFVKYLDDATLRQRRNAIPVIFESLAKMSPTVVGNLDGTNFGESKSVVKYVRIFRSNRDAPDWCVESSGLLADPTIDLLASKFLKTYVTAAPTIELIAYFESQPKIRPDLLPSIQDFIRNNIRDSPFSAVWLYSLAQDAVVAAAKVEHDHDNQPLHSNNG